MAARSQSPKTYVVQIQTEDRVWATLCEDRDLQEACYLASAFVNGFEGGGKQDRFRLCETTGFGLTVLC